MYKIHVKTEKHKEKFRATVLLECDTDLNLH